MLNSRTAEKYLVPAPTFRITAKITDSTPNSSKVLMSCQKYPRPEPKKRSLNSWTASVHVRWKKRLQPPDSADGPPMSWESGTFVVAAMGTQRRRNESLV